MSPQWATAIIMASGLVGNLCWTLVNLRIENKILERINGLKEWVHQNYEPRPTPLRPVVDHFRRYTPEAE